MLYIHTPPKTRKNKLEKAIGTVPSSPRDAREIADVVSPALPYSKDFGSFDLTLCEADDGRCVVLVEYEDRVFLNGKQIYITLEGIVADRDGHPNKDLQRNYECVLQEKRRMRNKSATKKNSGVGQRSGLARNNARNVSKSLEPGMATPLSRSTKQEIFNDSGADIVTEMSDIEGSFSDIIARLCEAILRYSNRGKDGKMRESHLGGNHPKEEVSGYVNATLDRLIDQFQSVVELSTNIDDEGDERNAIVDDDAMIEKWVAEAFSDTHGEKDESHKVETTGKTEKSNQKPSGVRTVGTQVKERRAEKKDKEGQTELSETFIEKLDRGEQTEKRFTGMTGDEKLIRELRDENRLLQGEVFALESEMREIQEQQQELEKRLEEETAAKLTSMKHLAEVVASRNNTKDESTNTRTKPGNSIGKELVKTMGKEVSPKTSIVQCTTSSTSINSLSSVTSSESETASVEESREPGVGMRQRSRALKSEIGRLRNVYSDVEDHLSKLAEENTNLRLRIGKLNREAKDMKNHMDQSDLACEEYQGEIKNLDKVNSQLEKKVAGITKEKIFVEEKLEAANDELTKLDLDRRRAEREILELNKKYESLSREKHNLSEEFGKLEKSHLEASAKAAKLSKISAEREVQLGILRGQIGDMTIETNQLRGENQTNSDARQRAERENRKLSSDLKATRKMSSELTAEVLQIRSKVDALEDTVNHLELENAQLKEKNVHLVASKDALAKQASDAEDRNITIVESLKEQESELYKFKRENFELRTTVEHINMINASIRTRLDNWGKESVDIGKRMKHLVGVKAELQSFIQQLNSVNTNIEERFEKMDSEYADLERKLHAVGKKDNCVDAQEVTRDCMANGKNSPILQEID
nr:myosin heavy chain, cardiac muscle isoform-like [Lytechinus pictus]